MSARISPGSKSVSPFEDIVRAARKRAEAGIKSPAITQLEVKNKGDKVIIRQTPDIAIVDYEKNMVGDIQYPEAGTIELNVDKAKAFFFKCDDIDKYQSDINIMEDWSNDASEQMKITIDSEFLGNVYADAAAANKGATAGRKSASFNLGVSGTPVAVTKSTILDQIVDLGTVLDEQNVPETDRWMVLPSWALGMLKKSDQLVPSC